MRGPILLIAAFAAAQLGGRGANRRSTETLVEPGVSESLAHERVARVSSLQYDLSFEFPAERSHPVSGRETIQLTLKDPSAPLIVDFRPNGAGRVRNASANGRAIEPLLTHGHIVVPASALRTGDNTLFFEFDAGDGPLNRNDDFLYTIFVPARAHEVFPCFDQPDLKARWRLSLTVPAGWEALANGAETARASQAGATTIRFARTEPLPTYLFAFAAGRFAIEQAERGGRTLRMFHRETDAQKVARNRDAIFDLHSTALDWMERYTAIPYPFGKFDFLLVPSFQFGGMEHPGAVFYNAAGILLEESATRNQELDRASTIAHETAHMWFGDLVTMRWFDDVWMKEVFANFMAAKIVNPSFPTIDHDLRFLLDYYPAAYAVDRTAGSNPIRQPLGNLADAGTLYGAIIYQKAPIVMRQLETIVTPDRFREGLRQYLREHAFGNASWTDLIALLDPLTPSDLASWSAAWVEQAGRPIITTRLRVENGTIAGLALDEQDPDQRRGLAWSQQLQLALGYDHRVQVMPVRLDGTSVDVAAARGLPTPRFVLPNGGGIGYGEFRLDEASRLWLARHIPDIDDGLTRGSAWVTMWDAMLDGEVSPETLVDLALEALPRERDELIVQRVLGYLTEAYWRFTPRTRREALAGRVEQTLQDGLAASPTTTLKGAYFAALRSVAVTPPTLRWLEAVWRRDERVPGLTLSEADDIQIVEELAVRAVAGAPAMLARQIERTRNPDRKARLQFVIPALSADQSTRDRFFASLAEPSNRQHEAWVLEAVRSLHHPLRTSSSEKYIQPSLELLEDIQRTGDIFFPKRWMDATLGGHASATAAGTVRQFLEAARRDYPDRLRRIILSSADDLFRAARITAT